ncbi:MAG: LptF/LptG family permease [Verrucomicrobiae bacterium]|nr:LptF/LptG family permease [Verrucomicrobiae bacterium]
MRLVDKYFLKEFLKPFFFCLGAFLLCWFVYDLLDNFTDFLETGSIWLIIKYYLAILPTWLVQVMPITLLLALLYTLADLSKHGELIALRAGGFDLYRLVVPVFGVALLLTVLTIFVNVSWAPRVEGLAKGKLGKLDEPETRGVIRNVFYKSLQAPRSWYIEQLDLDHGTAQNIDLVQSDGHGHDLWKYVAQTGFYRQGHWTLRDVIVYNLQKRADDPLSAHAEDTVEMKECQEDPQRFQASPVKPKRMTSRDLLLALELDKEMPKHRRAQYWTEIQSRFAFPFSNLIVILIGMPFGVTPQRRSAFLAITNALLIFVAYQLTSQFFVVLGNHGQIPPSLAVWLPNALFAALGIWLIKRVR